jgi:hypothetical protein
MHGGQELAREGWFVCALDGSNWCGLLRVVARWVVVVVLSIQSKIGCDLEILVYMVNIE